VSIGSEIAVKSDSSESSVGVSTEEDCSSADVYNGSAVGNDNSDASSAAAESENYLERSTADLSSSDSSSNEVDELDMSFAESDSAKTCLRDVTCEPVDVVSTTTLDGPPANAIDLTNMKLAVAADIDDDDHRHFLGSDQPYSDLKQHDAHISEPMLVSRVAMDIN